jgi:hypothetical protein
LKWIQANSAELDLLKDASDPLWDIALNQLKVLNDGLWFEFSEPNGEDREFIITAEGRSESFGLVETIVARAPRIPGWRIIALKPPMGFDFKTTYEGILFEPGHMWFLPLESNSHRTMLVYALACRILRPTSNGKQSMRFW